MRPPSCRQRVRLPATVVAGVVLLCQAAAWIHVAATPHVTCPEHGERVHLRAAPRMPAPAVDTAAVGPRTDETTTLHEHEHCGLQGQRATPAPTAPRPFSVAALTALPAPRTTVGGSAVHLLRLAPKTSPPHPPVS